MDKVKQTADRNKQIELLKVALEKAVGFKATTPKVFDKIQLMIINRTGEYVSSTTLKRLWGYLREPQETRDSTLSILVRALGFLDWNDFVSRNDTEYSESDISSSPKFEKSLNVSSDLTPGMHVLLTWYPGRECLVEYKGNLEFEVVDSKLTKLQKGMKFKCHLMIAGHPLYLLILPTEGMTGEKTITYECGKIHGGIQFEIIK